MTREEFISPFALFIAFSVIFAVWLSIYLHAGFQYPHFHVVEKMMLSSYFTIIGCIALLMGFGLLALVYSSVLWMVQKLIGIEPGKR
jgi:hypothetical protein